MQMIDQRRNVLDRAERRESKRSAVLLSIVFMIILCSGSIENLPL